MDSEIRKYCRHILKSRKEILRKDKQKKVWYWDWPAMVSICHDGVYKKRKQSYSHPPQGTKWNETLKKKMERLGNIGERSHLEYYIIGNCAEQHAGNNYMNSYKERNLRKLYFSDTVRPRTMQVFSPCKNCKYIFPNL